MNIRPVLAAGVSVAALVALPGTALGQAAAYQMDARYDAMGRVVGTIAPDPDGAGPLHFAAVRSTYDANGRLILVEKGELATWQPDSVAPSAWTGFTINTKVASLFDGYGRKTRDTIIGSDGINYMVTEYSYDSYDRPVCTAVRMTPTTYGGTVANDACTMISTTAPNADRIARKTLDSFGRITSLQLAYGSSDQITEASYTYLGNSSLVTSLIDARGYKATMSYDGFGRQLAWYFPNPTTPGVASTTDYESYTYDANGNRLTFRKRDGSLFSFDYDALNQMTRKVVPAGGSNNIYYGYDLRGMQLYARFGSAAGVGITNTYDGFGNLAATTNDMGAVSRILNYQYDADGDRTQLTFPDGSYFTYQYDGLDRLVGIKEGGVSTILTTTYNPMQSVASQTRGGVTITFGYDALSRPSSLSDDLAGTANDVASTFAYNAANQLVTKTRSNNAYAWSGYTNVSRAYVANGLNQYTTAGTAAFSYDLNGNLTADGSNSYVYDGENRMTSATMSGLGAVTLRYDPLGRLWQVQSPGSTQEFTYDGDALAMETSGTSTYRYVHGAMVDDPLFQYSGSGYTTRLSLQPDYQGSIVSTADAAGSAVTINAYDDYGIPKTGNSGRFQYTGQVWLGQLGFYYYKARMYSPTLGRFMQTDPVGYNDQVNLYRYAGNDPLNKKDPSGKDAIVIIKADGSINIIVPTTFSGDAATPANIAAYVENVQSTFTGTFDGVKVTTTVVNGTSPIDPSAKNEMTLTSGNTTNQPNGAGNNGHSYVYRGTVGQITTKDVLGVGIPSADGTTISTGMKGGNTAGHENGHFMGLPDTHRSGNGVMDDGGGNAVTGADIQTILKSGSVNGSPPTVTNTIIRCSEDPTHIGC